MPELAEANAANPAWQTWIGLVLLVVEASSWHLTARLAVTASAHEATATTQLRFKNAAARAEWAALGWMHRRAVPPILAGARRRLRV